MTTVCARCGAINSEDGKPVQCRCHPTTCVDGAPHALEPLDFTEHKSPCDLMPSVRREVHSLYCTRCGVVMKPVKP